MSDTPPRRRPAAFRLDAPNPMEERWAEPTDIIEPARAPRAVTDVAGIEFDAGDAIERDGGEKLESVVAARRRRGFPFGKLLAAAFGALVSIGVGFAIDGLVRDLFARADWLGWTAVGFVVLALVGLLGVVAREAAGLMQLAAVEQERAAATKAYDLDSTVEAKSVVDTLVALLSQRAETTEGRARLAALKNEIIDGRDMIALAERELLAPLDRNARTLVMLSAKRVSVVTAVSPRAIVDVSYVLFENVRLIRRMAELYGARPGFLGLVKLTRDVVGHLAVTGSISLGDNLVGQVVGHGLAARLSTRLGEGVVNGLLTARVGIAAMDLCRPLPFIRVRRPRIGDFVNDLARLPGDARKSQKGAGETTEAG